MLFMLSNIVLADEFSSTNFIVKDPVINVGGGNPSSSNFEVAQSIFGLAAGTSTSASFELWSGFQFYFKVTDAVLTATAGDGQVELSWTASSVFLGIVVDHYTVGTATVSGGPYTFENVGNVTSFTKTGLTNGTTHYFVIQTEDSASLFLARSSEASATPQAAEEEAAPARRGSIVRGARIFLAPIIAEIPDIAVEAVGTDLNGDGQINIIETLTFEFIKTNL